MADQSIVIRRATSIFVVSALCDPPFYLPVFKLPVGIRKRLDGLMRRFFWKGSESEDNRGMALIAWDVVCGRPLKWD